MRANRSRKSSRSRLMHKMAMTSEAAVMLKPLSRGTPPALPPSPITSVRRARSFMSITRFQTIVRGSSPTRFLRCKSLSISAASRLLAFSTAAKSPVKCKLISSIGTTWERPPPAAPPLMPNTGPSEGSRSAAAARSPMRLRPSVRPTVTVVLPSPAGVGLIAVTKTSWPWGSRRASSGILALVLP